MQSQGIVVAGHQRHFMNKDVVEEESRKNFKNRKKSIQPTHRMGRKTSSQLKYHFEKKEGCEATRMEVFLMLTSKQKEDGCRSGVDPKHQEEYDAMVQLVTSPCRQNDAEDLTPALFPEDAFRQVMGPKHLGRAGCAGRGATITSWFGKNRGASSQLWQESQNIKKKIASQKAEIDELRLQNKETMEKMERMASMFQAQMPQSS